MSSDYIGIYISSINQAVFKVIQLFQEHQYYEACHDLILVLDYLQINTEDQEKRIQEIVKSFEKIPEQAKQSMKGHTQAQRQYSYNHSKNRIAYTTARKGIRELRALMKEMGYFKFDGSGNILVPSSSMPIQNAKPEKKNYPEHLTADLE